MLYESESLERILINIHSRITMIRSPKARHICLLSRAPGGCCQVPTERHHLLVTAGPTFTTFIVTVVFFRMLFLSFDILGILCNQPGIPPGSPDACASGGRSTITGVFSMLGFQVSVILGSAHIPGPRNLRLPLRLWLVTASS